MRFEGGSCADKTAAKRPDANMKRMRQFLVTLLVVWTAVCIAAYFYSTQQDIPPTIAAALLPAFLAELAFYIMPAFPAARGHVERLGSKNTHAVRRPLNGSAP